MTQLYEDGTVVPVTLIQATPNVVASENKERDGYTAVQIGMETESAPQKRNRLLGKSGDI